MKKFTLLLIVAIGVIFFASIFLTSKAQVENKPQSVSPQTEIKSAYQQKMETFDALIEKARTEGPVRVIVGLDIANYKPEGELNLVEQKVKQEAIKSIQNNLIEKLRDYDLNFVRFEYIPYLVTKANIESLMAMKEMPEVTGIAEDKLYQPLLTESNSMIGSQLAWNVGYSGGGQTIAIIDSGVDKFHPFLQGRIVSEACYSGYDNVNNFPICNGSDNPLPLPEQGLIRISTAANSGLPVSHIINNNGISFPIAQYEHGTHVAGIAAGRGINYSGVAQDANIIAINTSHAKLTPNGFVASHYTSSMLLALQRVYALRNTFNIASVNLSLGSQDFITSFCDNRDVGTMALSDIIHNLKLSGIATVIATGNAAFNSQTGQYNPIGIASPACISHAIRVGSVNDGSPDGTFPPWRGTPTNVDEVSRFSQTALTLDLLAPGNGITSSIPGGGQDFYGGTSMAAPHVAGAWAIMKQRNPNASVERILNTFVNTGVAILDTRYNLIKPRIQVNNAVSLIGASCVVGQINLGQTVSGQLSNSDCSFTDALNRYFDDYRFNGSAGQQIAISMNSTSFDTKLRLILPNGSVLENDDISSTNTNSRIPISGFYTLPATGTYRILAHSFAANETGSYSLSIPTNTPTCTYSVTPANQNVGASAGSGSFTINANAGCQWQSSSQAGWLTTNSSGSGNGTVSFTYSANTSAQQRTGQISVGGQTFTLTQAGQQPTCTYSISPSSRIFNSSGGTGGFTVAAPIGCAWSLTANSSLLEELIGNYESKFSVFDLAPTNWLAVTSGGNGSGNGTVNYSVPQYIGPRRTGTITVSANGQAQAVHTVNQFAYSPFDYDGDSKADISVFRPSLGGWYISQSSNASFFGLGFGVNDDVITPADFDGDGKTDIAVFRPSNGTWYLQQSSNNFTAAQFGQNGDIPVPADYDGDGRADIAVFRPSNGGWYRLNSSNGEFVGMQFGVSEDKPTIGDFDNDGKADIAVFRPSTGSWYRLNSGNGQFVAAQFGIAEDNPVPADFDGDGKTDIAVFRPSTGGWYRLNSSNGEFVAVGFGISEDKPVPADYDGDGKADIAVFRPSAGSWYRLNSGNDSFFAQQFGITEDRPTPNAFIR